MHTYSTYVCTTAHDFTIDTSLFQKDLTMAKKRITSIDVARKAGVSQSTVSCVLSGHGRFSAETCGRVLTATSQLGNKPNALACSLITQQSNYIGIIMADFASPFYPNVLDKFTLRLQELRRQILLFNSLFTF